MGNDIWSYLLAGIIGIFVIFFFGPGVRASIERSRHAPKDWPGFLLPIGAVILFVLLLIQMV